MRVSLNFDGGCSLGFSYKQHMAKSIRIFSFYWCRLFYFIPLILYITKYCLFLGQMLVNISKNQQHQVQIVRVVYMNPLCSHCSFWIHFIPIPIISFLFFFSFFFFFNRVSKTKGSQNLTLILH